MSYLYLLFATASVGTLGVLHKVADHRQCRPSAINLLLFFVAGVLSMLLAVHQMGRAVLIAPRLVLEAGISAGICASLAILLFQKGIRLGKISTSWLIIQLSTAIPTVLSILVYHEQVSLRRSCSLGLSILALLLMWEDRRREDRRREDRDSANAAVENDATRETA